MDVYIWGTGHKAKEYIETGEINDTLSGFIETKRSKRFFFGYPVYEPDEMALKEYSYILVLVHDHTKEIYSTAVEAGLDISRFVFIDNWKWINDDSIRHSPPQLINPIIPQQIECYDIQRLFPILYERFIDWDYQNYNLLGVTRRNSYDLVDKNKIIGKTINDSIYLEDYFRYRTFEFVANEIIKDSLDGDLAELGVFRGDFARLINAKFPEKRLYLFDTFESFDKDEFEKELNQGHCGCDFRNAFVDTSVDFVLSRLPHKERCIVKKGLFPETAKDLQDKEFCFVSLDVDLEQSTYDGLCFFYPRLVEGGYMFIHDYNSRQLQGVKRAVERFEKKISKRIAKVPIADSGGTLIVSR